MTEKGEYVTGQIVMVVLSLVAAFAIATVKVFELAKTDDVAGWEKACRVQAMYATKLRLSPQATCDPQTIGRRRKDDNEAVEALLRLNDKCADEMEKPWHWQREKDGEQEASS